MSSCPLAWEQVQVRCQSGPYANYQLIYSRDGYCFLGAAASGCSHEPPYACNYFRAAMAMERTLTGRIPFRMSRQSVSSLAVTGIWPLAAGTKAMEGWPAMYEWQRAQG